MQQKHPHTQNRVYHRQLNPPKRQLTATSTRTAQTHSPRPTFLHHPRPNHPKRTANHGFRPPSRQCVAVRVGRLHRRGRSRLSRCRNSQRRRHILLGSGRVRGHREHALSLPSSPTHSHTRGRGQRAEVEKPDCAASRIVRICLCWERARLCARIGFGIRVGCAESRQVKTFHFDRDVAIKNNTKKVFPSADRADDAAFGRERLQIFTNNDEDKSRFARTRCKRAFRGRIRVVRLEYESDD